MATLHGKLLSLLQKRGYRFAFGMQKEDGGYRKVLAGDYADAALRFSAYLKSRGVQRGDGVHQGRLAGPAVRRLKGRVPLMELPGNEVLVEQRVVGSLNSLVHYPASPWVA